MKAVMVDGPKSGEVITTEWPLSEIVCFAIPVAIPVPWKDPPDLTKGLQWPTANYRRVSRVLGKDGAIDVYEFLGMT